MLLILITYIELNLLFRIYLKGMSLFSCCFWGVLFSKILQTFFTDKLTFCNWKSVLRHLLGSKAFSTSRKSYPRCYFHDLLTNTSVMAAMLPFMVRLNVILRVYKVFLSKKWKKKIFRDCNLSNLNLYTSVATSWKKMNGNNQILKMLVAPTL